MTIPIILKTASPPSACRGSTLKPQLLPFRGDVPLVLLGSLQDLVLANTASDPNRFAPLVTWMNLLNGGGRIALSVAAALLAIATAQTLAPYLHTPVSKQNLGSAV